MWLVPWMLAVVLSPHGGLGVDGLGTLGWIYGGVIMLMMMDSAAARIGPPSENHSTRVRALALGAALVAFPLSAINGAVATTMALFIVLPTLIGALNEPVRPVARLYAPFTRGSELRKLLTLPFCPGWPGGLAFGVVVAIVLPFLPEISGRFGLFFWLSIVATFALPAALMHTVFSHAQRRTGYYLLILAISSVPVYVHAFAEGMGMTPLATVLRSLGGFAPPLAAILELSHSDGYESALFVRTALSVVTAVCVVALAIRSRRERRRITELTRDQPPPLPAERLALAG
jgi:hypothetical protein